MLKIVVIIIVIITGVFVFVSLNTVRCSDDIVILYNPETGEEYIGSSWCDDNNDASKLLGEGWLKKE